MAIYKSIKGKLVNEYVILAIILDIIGLVFIISNSSELKLWIGFIVLNLFMYIFINPTLNYLLISDSVLIIKNQINPFYSHQFKLSDVKGVKLGAAPLVGEYLIIQFKNNTRRNFLTSGIKADKIELINSIIKGV